MKINEFLTEDLDLLRAECNFTDNESNVFELKARGWTDVQIALELNMSESNVQVIMRKIRNKIDEVLRRNVRHLNQESVNSCSRCIVGHTMSEWAKIPDFLSSKNVIYIYSDYRTEGEIRPPLRRNDTAYSQFEAIDHRKNKFQMYLFSSPICHFERSEKSVPFCVDNTDFSAMNRLEMTGY